MPLTIEAIYENGVLKPLQPLPFQEQEKVASPWSRSSVRPSARRECSNGRRS